MSDRHNAARRGNAGLAFIFGGIAVGLATIAFLVFSNSGVGTPDGTDVSVAINLPRMEMPASPKMPTQPQVVPLESRLPEPAPADGLSVAGS
jgi:hypothetical protein